MMNEMTKNILKYLPLYLSLSVLMSVIHYSNTSQSISYQECTNGFYEPKNIEEAKMDCVQKTKSTESVVTSFLITLVTMILALHFLFFTLVVINGVEPTLKKLKIAL